LATNQIDVYLTPFDGEVNEDFDCGSSSLNSFYKKHLAAQSDMNLLKAHIAVNMETGRTIGFVTLSSSELDTEGVGIDARYSKVPFVRIGRLAVDKEFQGQGLGEALVAHAMLIAVRMSEMIGVSGVFVDAVPSAVGFYEKYGFSEFKLQSSDEHRTKVMFLPLPVPN
jgi:ribosomal protein S18 acetylase RimI-like enzyme